MKACISEIAARLNANCELVAIILCGYPNERLCNKREWRWGENGRFKLNIAGQNRGKWIDFAANDHGDTLDLIGREFGFDKLGAVDWALDWLGGDIGGHPIHCGRPDRSSAVKGDGDNANYGGQHLVADAVGGGASHGVKTIATGVQSRSPVVAENLTNLALQTWRNSAPMPGTIAERYLQIRCGSIPADILAADTLRFHPRCYFKLADGPSTRLPALIGLFRDMRTGEPVAIHRTALLPNGSGKDEQTPSLGNPKKMLGPSAGAAIMLSPFEEITLGLGICEGIETGISIAQFDWRPLWVVGSAGGIARFPPFSGLDCLTIFADHDENGACQTAATECRDHLSQHNIEVDAIMPRTKGNDWNDTIQAMKNAA